MFLKFQMCLNNMGCIQISKNYKMDPEQIIPDPQHWFCGLDLKLKICIILCQNVNCKIPLANF